MSIRPPACRRPSAASWSTPSRRRAVVSASERGGRQSVDGWRSACRLLCGTNARRLRRRGWVPLPACPAVPRHGWASQPWHPAMVDGVWLGVKSWRPNPLRSIPSVNELLESPAIKAVVDRIHPGAVMATVRSVLDEVAAEMRSAVVERTWPSVGELAERIRAACSTAMRPTSSRPSTPPASSSTRNWAAHRWPTTPSRQWSSPPGSTRSGRAPWCSATPPGRATASGVLLKNLHPRRSRLRCRQRRRGHRARVGRAGRRPRGDRRPRRNDPKGRPLPLARVGRLAGVALREVGAVNRLLPEDYARVITDRSAALAVVHPGASRSRGARPWRRSKRSSAWAGIMGCRWSTTSDRPACSTWCRLAWPCAGRSQSIAAGADLVLLEHEMFGGPACGIIAGRQTWVDRIRRAAMAGAFQPPPPALALAAATLRLIETPEEARLSNPGPAIGHDFGREPQESGGAIGRPNRRRFHRRDCLTRPGGRVPAPRAHYRGGTAGVVRSDQAVRRQRREIGRGVAVGGTGRGRPGRAGISRPEPSQRFTPPGHGVGRGDRGRGGSLVLC